MIETIILTISGINFVILLCLYLAERKRQKEDK